MAVAPYYAGLWLHSGNQEGDMTTECGSLPGGAAQAPETTLTLTYLRVVRLVRVVRILKLTKYSFGLQVIHGNTA